MVEFDLAVSQIAEMVGDELRTEHALNLMMDDKASLELVTGFEVKLGTLMALDGMAAQGLAHERDMLNLLGGIELATLNATYLDDGLLDTLIAASAAESNISPAEMHSAESADLPGSRFLFASRKAFTNGGMSVGSSP